MAISQPPILFDKPFADAGDKTIIPSIAGALGKANLQEGFPPITQVPLGSGGIAPDRLDFNGILYMLSAYAHWQQSGGMFEWSDTLDYAPPSIVYRNGKFYYGLAESGPGTTAGAQDPETATVYWQEIAAGSTVYVNSGFTISTVPQNNTFTIAAALSSVQNMFGVGSELSINGNIYEVTAMSGTATTTVTVSPASLVSSDIGGQVWATPLENLLDLSSYAKLASPAFTGIPTTPTAVTGSNNAQIANTQFVVAALSIKANQNSPAFTGTPTAPTASATTNNTQIATTAYVTNAANRAVNIPVGTILTYPSNTAPAGFILCNGAEVGRAAYPELFAVIGTTFGAGNGTTTFKLPDLRGEFIRGLDLGRGVDAGRTLGSYQADAFASHTHPVKLSNSATYGTVAAVGRNTHTLDIDSLAAGGAETRPRNVALVYYIKAFGASTNQGLVDTTQLANDVATLSANSVGKGEFTQDFSENGWSKLPNGLIIQWGHMGNISPPYRAYITFPISFKSQIFSVTGNAVYSGGTTNAGEYPYNITLTNFEYFTLGVEFYWLALGI